MKTFLTFLTNQSKRKTSIDIKVTRKPKPTKNNTRPYLNEIPTHFIHEINTITYDVSDVNLFLPPTLMRLPPQKRGLKHPSYTTIRGIWWSLPVTVDRNRNICMKLKIDNRLQTRSGCTWRNSIWKPLYFFPFYTFLMLLLLLLLFFFNKTGRNPRSKQ